MKNNGDNAFEGFISSIVEDENSRVWISSSKEIYTTDDLARVQKYDAKNLIDGSINTLYADGNGTVWAGTTTGLFKINLSDRSIKRVSRSLIVNAIDGLGKSLYVGTSDGLYYCNQSDTTIMKLTEIGEKVTSLRIDPTYRSLWIGGENHVWITELDSQIRQIKMKEFQVNAKVNCIINDKSNNTWLGTGSNLGVSSSQNGLLKANYSNGEFNGPQKASLSMKDYNILSILVDRSNVLWVGTYAGGLYQFNNRRDQFRHFKKSTFKLLPSDIITAIYKDRGGNLWVGTLNDGLCIETDGNGSRFPIKPHGISTGEVKVIFEDSYGDMWIGTKDGLYHRMAGAQNFSVYKNRQSDSSSLSSNVVRVIYEDSKNDLWIGTNDGLNKFNRKTGDFLRFISDSKDSSSLSDNFITCIAENNAGMWIGTLGGGVNLLDKRTLKFCQFRYSTQNIQGIRGD
ncbi:MAG: hypothetical protein KDC99_19815, partial [Cyclobacteriaceae bacterium]|nr:hypothetical protein [Cyclobacteriaceae bacterium]